MKRYILIILLSNLLANVFEYSLLDYNTSSPTHQLNVWYPEYSNHITMHYFATQGWAGWTATFGQLSNFQEELKNDYGFENVVIIAIGQTNISSFNNSFCANSDLPLVMDEFPELPIREQFSPYGESHDFVIIDYDGNYLDHINFLSLGNVEKNYIIDVLEDNYNQIILGDVNGDTFVNIQDVILLVNIILNNSSDNIDINGDGSTNILDVIQIVNIILNWNNNPPFIK